MSVVVVDYGSGNLRSAAKACERAARDRGLNLDVKISGRAEDVRAAERIVLPGQGAFGECKRGLAAVPGMIEALEESVIRKKRPFLGICVGMQLMAERGLEHGVHQGLGWLPGDVVAMTPADKALKIPHMGWNELFDLAPHPVLEGVARRPVATPISSTPTSCAAPGRVMCWPRATTAGASPRSSGATIWSAPSSTSRKARRRG
jgi:glutamine amidotransferase